MGGHRFACFHPLGSPQNAEALERNLAAGLPQAIALLDRKDGEKVDLSALLAAETTNGAAGAADPWSGGEGGKTEEDRPARQHMAIDE